MPTKSSSEWGRTRSNEWLRDLGKQVLCFDLLYTTRWPNPGDIYEFMVSALLKEASIRGEATYSVPGSPNAGLTIRQMPTGYNEAVIREIGGRVGYVLPVFIRRDEPGKTIIRDWTLHVPWDGCVEWLDEDQKRNRGWYTFS